MVEKLRNARGYAWKMLQPAFDHAISMAEECEYLAGQASNMAQTACEPAYPPLVVKMAEASPDVRP